MKKIFCFLLIASFSAQAQKYDRVWVFGDSAGIDFNNLASPVAISPIVSYIIENSYSMADSNGNLIFYMTGAHLGTNLLGYNQIFNSAGLLMANGDSIDTEFSITNGFTAVTFPNDSFYYCFYLCRTGGSDTITAKYAKINMNLSGGLGKVILKNILLDPLHSDSLAEKITAIKHANGRDWWIITHLESSNAFKIFLLTPQGISPPTYESIGPNLLYGPNGGYYFGEICPSQNGDKIVMTSTFDSTILLFSFDRCNGSISYFKNLSFYVSPSQSKWPYGVSFSSDGSIIYFSTARNGGGASAELFQIDISDTSSINSVLLFTAPGGLDIGQHQIGPDGKIYITTYTGNPLVFVPADNHHTKVSVINNPDISGVGCNFVPFSFSLNGKKMSTGLPNLPNYNLGALADSPCDTLGLGEPQLENSLHGVSLFPNPNSGSFTLNYFLPHGSTGKLEIYNLFGEEVNEQELKKNSNAVQLNLVLAQGFYLCRVVSGNQNAGVKFVVEK